MRNREYREHAKPVSHQLDHKYAHSSNKNVFTDDLFVFLFPYLRFSKSRNNPKGTLSPQFNPTLRQQTTGLFDFINFYDYSIIS